MNRNETRHKKYIDEELHKVSRQESVPGGSTPTLIEPVRIYYLVLTGEERVRFNGNLRTVVIGSGRFFQSPRSVDVINNKEIFSRKFQITLLERKNTKEGSFIDSSWGLFYKRGRQS